MSVEKAKFNLPIEEVYAKISNPENLPHMFINTEEVKNESENEAPAVGNSYQVVKQISNQKVVTPIEITKLERNKEFEYLMDLNHYSCLYNYQFSKGLDDETEVIFESTLQGGRGIRKLLRPFFKAMIEKEDRDHLAYFKNNINEIDV